MDRGVMIARLRRCCESARPGTVQVMLRDPELPIRAKLALGEQLRRLTYDTGQSLSVRDRLDLAILLDSDAIHLAEQSVLPSAIRDRYGTRFFISAAWHARHLPPPVQVDAVLLSPVCAPRKNQPALGLDGLRTFLADHHGCGVFALGGVTRENARACVRSGALGVAVIGAVLSQDDPLPLLRELDIAQTNLGA
jgi:thiamine-phosphate pyrophosphorylase